MVVTCGAGAWEEGKLDASLGRSLDIRYLVSKKTYMLFVDLVICIYARTICSLEGVGWRTRKSGSDVSDLSIL